MPRDDLKRANDRVMYGPYIPMRYFGEDVDQRSVPDYVLGDLEQEIVLRVFQAMQGQSLVWITGLRADVSKGRRTLGDRQFFAALERLKADKLLEIDCNDNERYWRVRLSEEGTAVAEELAVKPRPSDAVGTGYVASRKFQVFHRPSCKGASKISAKNLVRYATRDEAIQAGKKPCHECNP